LLFTIDQRPYRAALAEASANVASARSALALARSDYARASRLTGDEAVSAGEVDSLRARCNRRRPLWPPLKRVCASALDSNSPKYARRFGPGFGSPRRCRQSGRGGRGRQCDSAHHDQRARSHLFHFDSSEALFLKSQRAGRKRSLARGRDPPAG
jgi:hypothetical protein